MAKKISLKTNAMRQLERAKIAYQVKEYECDGIHLEGELVARQIQFPPEQVFKTLLTCWKDTYVVAILPVNQQLDLKKLALLQQIKRLEMLPLVELLPVTGYIRGGCSPIGMKKQFSTFLDESALKFDLISVSAGTRGMQLLLNPEDLLHITKGKTGSLCMQLEEEA